jgi:hypothetical protein
MGPMYFGGPVHRVSELCPWRPRAIDALSLVQEHRMHAAQLWGLIHWGQPTTVKTTEWSICCLATSPDSIQVFAEAVKHWKISM